MSSTNRRLRKLEAASGQSGAIRMVCFTDLPEDPEERAEFIEQAKRDGRARQRGGVLIITEPKMTSEEWVKRFAPGGPDHAA